MVREDYFFRLYPLEAGTHRRRPSMGGFGTIQLKVIVEQYRTSHRRDRNRSLANSKFVDHLGNQFVDQAVRTARAVVC